MEKLPRSGPLFDAMFEAVSEVGSLGNTAGTPGGINEGEALEAIYERVAKKYGVPSDLLKKADNNFNDVFESPKSAPKGKVIGGKTFPLSPENAKALGRAVDDDYAASIRKLLTEQVEQGVFNTAKKPAGIASKVINTASGVAKQALKAGMKAAGPVGAALTAGELGGALAELRELGAEKIAAKNEAKQGYSSEERLKLKEMLKKLKGNPALRE